MRETLSIIVEISKNTILKKEIKFNKDWILKKKCRLKLKSCFNLM